MIRGVRKIKSSVQRWRISICKELTSLPGKTSHVQIQVGCLQKMLAEEEGGELVVTIEKFSNLLKWYGKIKQDTFNVMDRLESVMKKDWFFGDLGSSEAENKLKTIGKPGTFLVRLNMGGQEAIEKTPFTITRLDEKGKAYHTRVYPKEDSGSLIKIKKGSEEIKIRYKSPNIEDFITYLQQQDSGVCSTVCAGYPFRDIFSGKPVERSPYEEASDDEAAD